MSENTETNIELNSAFGIICKVRFRHEPTLAHFEQFLDLVVEE